MEMPCAKCHTCAVHREQMSATSCPREKARLKAVQLIHLERAKRERLSCVMRQRLARLYPHAQQYTSMIIDGAADTTVGTNLL